MTRDQLEIMAPVGSRESLAAALQARADAIYFGVDDLNMRARSTANFTADDIPSIVDACAERRVKSYLALNTVIYQHELDRARRLLDRARQEGVSAVIASDPAVILHASRVGLEVHASTQCNITNIDAFRHHARHADVIVLARELDLPAVADIHRRVVEGDIRGPGGQLARIEMFVHGALCMAVSGKCYLSLHAANASANRGACMQPCRHSYIVRQADGDIELEIDNERVMSPKDLCTIGFLDRIIEAGVSVFKIEGRARPPEYVRVTCTCYDEALRAIIDGDYTPARVAEWTRRLSTVFHRGFWDGYYLGRRLGEWSTARGSLATRHKERVGRVTNYYKQPRVAECYLEAGELATGDRLLVTGHTTGVEEFIVNELRLDDGPVSRVRKGMTFSFHSPALLRRGDTLYKWNDT